MYKVFYKEYDSGSQIVTMETDDLDEAVVEAARCITRTSGRSTIFQSDLNREIVIVWGQNGVPKKARSLYSVTSPLIRELVKKHNRLYTSFEDQYENLTKRLVDTIRKVRVLHGVED